MKAPARPAPLIWFDRTPVDPLATLNPPSMRFDGRRSSISPLLARLRDPATTSGVGFDVGWDSLALEVWHGLVVVDPTFTISTATARAGELTIATSIDDVPTVQHLLAEASRASTGRCERCGEPGRPVRCMPRVRTLCADHAAEHRFDEAVRMTVEHQRAAGMFARSA